MKSIILIIPYFGEFPSYFQLFLKSCEYNSSINWVLITDNKRCYEYPPNVKRENITFDVFSGRVQEKFDFKISLESPYKLCDYKPMYGYLFPELVEGYDYWGYCDLDVIYGDIRSFLTDEVLTFPKIFEFGHFTLVENSIQYNKLFMNEINGELLYKNVIMSPMIYHFDETFKNVVNINTFFEQAGLKIFKKSYVADIYTKSSFFILDDGLQNCEARKEAFFVWNKGKLVRYIKSSVSIISQEYMYIHLQKRKMKVRVNQQVDTCFKIIPNSFDKLETSVDEITAKFKNIRKRRINIQYFKIRSKNLFFKIMKVCGLN